MLKKMALLPLLSSAVAAVALAREKQEFRRLIIYRDGSFKSNQPYSEAKPKDIVWVVAPGDHEDGKCYEVGGPPVFVDHKAGYGFPCYAKPHLDVPKPSVAIKWNGMCQVS